jgi:tetratricopeptide (TPR) repeat protein
MLKVFHEIVLHRKRMECLLAKVTWKLFFAILCVAPLIMLASETSVLAQHRKGRHPGFGRTPQVLIRIGKRQMEAHRYVLAVRSFSAAIQKNPHIAEAYLLRGTAYDHMAVYHAAIKDLTHYIELNPKDPEGYLRRADARNFSLEHQLALEDYTEALRLRPSSTPALLGQGLAYTGLQNYDEATKDYQRVLAKNPYNTEALGNMGVTCMMAGRSVEAMQYFERALKLETNPEWRARMETWEEKLLEEASARKAETTTNKRAAGPVKGIR